MLEIAKQLILKAFPLLNPNLPISKLYFQVLALKIRFHSNHAVKKKNLKFLFLSYHSSYSHDISINISIFDDKDFKYVVVMVTDLPWQPQNRTNCKMLRYFSLRIVTFALLTLIIDVE